MNVQFRGRLIAEENPVLAESEDIRKSIQHLEVVISPESRDVVQKAVYVYTEKGTKHITLPMRRDPNGDIFVRVLISGNGQGNIYDHFDVDMLTYFKDYRARVVNVNKGTIGGALIGVELRFRAHIKKYTFTHPEDASTTISGLKFILDSVSLAQ
jgi:hypothetical protein